MNKSKYAGVPFFAFVFFVSLIFSTGSCKPVIHSFRVTTHDTTVVRKMTADDILEVNWDVKGKPTILLQEIELPDTAGKVLEIKLVVKRGKKEVNQVVQVEILPTTSITTITFNTKLFGDTLVAEGDKNPGVWGDRFEISVVANKSGRPLLVTHGGRTALLDKQGTVSDFFAGTHLEGKWILKSLLTPAEKADHSLLPERLQVNAVINYKRR